VNTRARSLSGPVDDPELVKAVALDLLGEFSDAEVRKLGVRVSNLDFTDADQSTIDGWDSSEGREGGGGNANGENASDDPDTADTAPGVEVTTEEEQATIGGWDDSAESGGSDSESTWHVRRGQTRLPEFVDEE
jgi:DNA polymerase IV (DinB-like DNA polymerase)